MTADGLLFGVVTKVEKKGTDEGPEKGDLFSFECKIDKDVLTLSELTGSKAVSDEGKQLLGGAVHEEEIGRRRNRVRAGQRERRMQTRRSRVRLGSSSITDPVSP